MWESLWLSVFGRTEWMGLDMGFWVSMAVVAVIVIIQNIVFWKCFSPFDKYQEHLRQKEQQQELRQL